MPFKQKKKLTLTPQLSKSIKSVIMYTIKALTSVLLPALTAILAVFTSCTSSEGIAVINEICGNDNNGDEWVELYNPTSHTLHLQGWRLIKIDENGIDSNLRKFKNDSILPHGFLLLSRTEGTLKGKLSTKKELGIELLAPNDKTIDRFYRDDEIGETSHPTGGSYSRNPDGLGAWYIVRTATPGMLNADDVIMDDGLEEFDISSESEE